jgi:hypothetical protein
MWINTRLRKIPSEIPIEDFICRQISTKGFFRSGGAEGVEAGGGVEGDGGSVVEKPIVRDLGSDFVGARWEEEGVYFEA